MLVKNLNTLKNLTLLSPLLGKNVSAFHVQKAKSPLMRAFCYNFSIAQS